MMATASHCFYSYKNAHQAHQPNNYSNNSLVARRTNKIRYDNNPIFDAACVSIDSDNSVSFELAQNSCRYHHYVAGAVFNSKLKDMEGTNQKIRMKGRTSGYEEGTVDHVGRTAYRTTMNSADGDSGGPHYILRSNGNALIAGIHKGDTNVGARATKMVSVEDQFNVIV